MSVQGLEFDKPTLENGGRSQEAIVVTSPDKQHVNAPTVEDIKRIAKGEAETEGNKSYTKAESDAKFLSKTDAASSYAAKDSVYTKTESDAKYQKKYTNTVVAFLVPKSDTQNDFETSDMNNISKLNVGDLVMIRAVFQDVGDNGTTCIGLVKSKGTNNMVITLNLNLPDFGCVVYQLSASLQSNVVRLLPSSSGIALAEEDITFSILK